MAPDDTDPDVSDLRERVSELETDKQKLRARLDDQQETIQKLMPSRRQTLAGLGLLSAGGVAGRLSSGTAKAQAAGLQGTEENPNDMFAWDLNVQNSVTSDLPMGGNDVTDVGALETEQASIGEIQQIEIEEGADKSRSPDTQYQNTEDYTIMLEILTSPPDTGEMHANIAVSQSSSGLSDGPNRIGLIRTDALEQYAFSAIVPPGYYYEFQLRGGDDGTTISVWTERGMRA